jgi:quinol monooxygenase YgiN
MNESISNTMNSDFYVIESIPAVKGQEKLLAIELKKLIKPSTQEKGCIEYIILKDRANPDVFTVFMQWECEEDFIAHNHSKHIQEFVKKFKNVLYEDKRVTEKTYHLL